MRYGSALSAAVRGILDAINSKLLLQYSTAYHRLGGMYRCFVCLRHRQVRDKHKASYIVYYLHVQLKKKKPEILVNYHLHEQTGRLTVWVNDRQNSGLVNFVLESLTFVQIGSIYWKTVVALKKSNTNFCLEDSIRKNRTALWEIFRRKLLVNGIQPLNWKLEFRWNTHQWRTCSIWQWFHSFPPWAEPKWPRDRLKLAKLHENTEKVSNGKRELPFQKFHVLRKLLSGRHEKLCAALTFQPASPVFLVRHSR